MDAKGRGIGVKTLTSMLCFKRLFFRISTLLNNKIPSYLGTPSWSILFELWTSSQGCKHLCSNKLYHRLACRRTNCLWVRHGTLVLPCRSICFHRNFRTYLQKRCVINCTVVVNWSINPQEFFLSFTHTHILSPILNPWGEPLPTRRRFGLNRTSVERDLWKGNANIFR